MTRFLLFGYGHIGKRHEAIVEQFPEASLSAVIENDRSKWPSHGSVPFFLDIVAYEKSKLEADVAILAVPNGLHCSLAIACIETGMHVVIEKPMGLHRAECEAVIEASQKHGRQVFVVKQNRYSPPAKWLKELVKNKTIGDTLIVQVNCFWNRDERYYKADGWKGTKDLDGGTLFTQFSHFIDIMNWVFGDIQNIHSTIRNFTHQNITEFEDSGIVQFEFVNGGIGSINFSTSVWDSNLESSITLIGTKGSVKVGGQYMNEIEHCHIDNYVMPKLEPTNPPNDYGPYKGSAANHHYVIENVINTLKGTDTITANAMEGMAVVDIIERIYKAQK